MTPLGSVHWTLGAQLSTSPLVQGWIGFAWPLSQTKWIGRARTQTDNGDSFKGIHPATSYFLC